MNKSRIDKAEAAAKARLDPGQGEVLHVARLQSTGLYMIQADMTPGEFDYRVISRPLAGLPEDFTLTLAEVEAEAARLGRVVNCDFVIG